MKVSTIGSQLFAMSHPMSINGASLHITPQIAIPSPIIAGVSPHTITHTMTSLFCTNHSPNNMREGTAFIKASESCHIAHTTF